MKILYIILLLLVTVLSKWGVTRHEVLIRNKRSEHNHEISEVAGHGARIGPIIKHPNFSPIHS